VVPLSTFWAPPSPTLESRAPASRTLTSDSLVVAAGLSEVEAAASADVTASAVSPLDEAALVATIDVVGAAVVTLVGTIVVGRGGNWVTTGGAVVEPGVALNGRDREEHCNPPIPSKSCFTPLGVALMLEHV
jgi:hypothetical protein